MATKTPRGQELTLEQQAAPQELHHRMSRSEADHADVCCSRPFVS